MAISLADYLSAAHRHSVHGGIDPAPACAKEIPPAEIHAKLAELQAVRARSHGARVMIAFLDRVLRLVA